MHHSRLRSVALAAAISLSIPVALLTVSPAMGAPVAGPVRADTSGVADAQWASDEAGAQAIAQQYGHPVAVDSEASPTQLVSAMPDGTMQLESDAVPQRVRQGTSWVAVDTTLRVNSDGMFAPTASAAPVEFSVGGTDLIDRVQTTSGAWVTETWPYGALPSAVVDGSSVTYPGVLPGVDLRLTAAPGGMSEVLVVHDAAAAANPQLATLHLGVPDATVSVNTLAQVKAVKADGSSAQAAAPTWWDSSEVNAGPGGPGGEASPRPLGDASSGSGLTLNIAAALSGASPVFPVFVDPEWTYPTGAPYWFTDAAYPDQSYLNGNYADGIQSVGNSGVYKSDAFWQYSISKVAHTHILKATMNTTQVWAATCSPSDISVAAYGPEPAGFTWNQEWYTYGSAKWGAYLDTQNPNYGCSGVAANAVGWTVTSAVAASAAAGSSSIQLGLEPRYRTSDTSRRHYSQSASLTIDYNHPPVISQASLMVSAPSRGCGTAADPAYVNNGDAADSTKVGQAFTLSAIVTDADGDPVNATFSIVSADQVGLSNPTILFSQNTGNQTQSATVPLTEQFVARTLTDGKAYAWRVIAGDRYDLSQYSGWCYVTDDATPPVLPNLTSTGQPVVGQPMKVSVTEPSNSDGTTDRIWGYSYWWSDTSGMYPQQPPVTAINPSAPLGSCPSLDGGTRYFCTSNDNNSVTLTVAPVDTTSTLWVAAYDKAGNVSVDSSKSPAGTALPVQASEDPAVSYSTGHGWITDSLASSATSVPDANTTVGTGLTDEDDVSLASTTSVMTDAPNGGSSLSFPGTQTVATQSARKAVDSTKSFTVSAWLKPSSSGAYAAVAESGPVNSGFELRLNAGQWEFCVRTQVTPVVTDCARGSSGYSTTSWTFVSGIWDAVNQQARLVVQGAGTVAVAPHLVPAGDVSANGPITVGSAVSASQVSEKWAGGIGDPTIFPGVADEQQLGNLSWAHPPQ
jgi:hypothetical protein